MGKSNTWTTIASNSSNFGEQIDRQAVIKREKKFNDVINSTKIRTLKQMKSDSENEAAKKKAREDSLIKAYDNNQLKSEALIQEARAIKKARSHRAKKEDVA